MSKIFFTADTHFGHRKIIEFQNRPWPNIEEMDAEMIEVWNENVRPNDVVWHLGDVAIRKPEPYLEQLNGQIHLIRGNHDPKRAPEGVVWFGDVRYLRHQGYRFFLSHYAHRVWPNSHQGTFHLFGHSHGQIPDYHRSMDVGVDVHGFRPITIEEVIEILEPEDVTLHHPEMAE